MSASLGLGALHREMADLPLPAGGRTAARHRRLYDWARRDVSLSRLAEAHCDALAILAEAGRVPVPGARYGVWAAQQPGLELRLVEAAPSIRATAATTLEGAKAFCTGAGIVDRALITVSSHRGGGSLLVDLAVGATPDGDGDEGSISFDTSGWITAAFADTATATATFHRVAVHASDIVGRPGWYLDRPGFWAGAIGPACCWAGGAAGLVDAAERDATTRRADPVDDLQLGALFALRWRMEQLLDGAGAAVDRGLSAPDLQQLALVVRHEIDVAAGEIVDRFSRRAGPRALAFDAGLSRRIAEVQLYRRQCHAEHDLVVLGGLIRVDGAAQASVRTDGSRS